jgi:hypothetical protein
VSASSCEQLAALVAAQERTIAQLQVGSASRTHASPRRIADRGAGAAAGRLLAQLLQAALGRRAGQAGAEVAAQPVRAQAGWSARVGGPHAAAGRAAR